MTKISVKGPIVDNDTGWLYHWLGWDCCCPGDIAKGLEEADGDDIILEINSPGGYCDMGSEIYTMLMEYGGKIEAHIMAAASAASVVACAADRVLASDTMVYMIHNSEGGMTGDYRDMLNKAEELQKYNESIINAYVRKTGKSREELQEMMDHTTWMSAADAIAHGFADDYLFGDPGKRKEGQGSSTVVLQTMNAEVLPVISLEKTKKIMASLKFSERWEDFPEDYRQQIPTRDSGSDIATGNMAGKEKGGKSTMTLEELLKENPEARAELDTLVEAARKKGVQEENARLEELDGISASVVPEDLREAKYGENPMDARTLAYQALVKDGEKARNYMQHAIEDSKNAGMDEVGSNTSDPEEPKDESDSMAAIANAKIGK